MLLSSSMDKEVLCKNILKDINKSDVGVKVSQDIKGNYYSYINNCIYLNNKKCKMIEAKAKENVVVAHECIHATQNKAIHIANVILANLELLSFLAFVIICFAFKSIEVFKIVYITICTLSIIFRCILEFPAMINSFGLAQKYSSKEVSEIIQENRKKMKYLLPLGILSYTWFKILRLILVIIL